MCCDTDTLDSEAPRRVRGRVLPRLRPGPGSRSANHSKAMSERRTWPGASTVGVSSAATRRPRYAPRTLRKREACSGRTSPVVDGELSTYTFTPNGSTRTNTLLSSKAPDRRRATSAAVRSLRAVRVQRPAPGSPPSPQPGDRRVTCRGHPTGRSPNARSRRADGERPPR